MPARYAKVLGKRLPKPVKKRLRAALPQRHWRHFDPTWYRHTMGTAASWNKLGKLQCDFLVAHGLQPSHHLLDVGCGPLRAGVHFIRYLEPGHYYGVERRGDRLDIGREIELPRHGLTEKRPVLTKMGDFGFERLGQKFDYALAQSVFTHLPMNNIIRCLMNMERVLVSGGQFYATIYLNERGKQNLDPIEQTPRIFSAFDRNPFHYDVATFEWMCEGTGLSVEYLGDWDSPRNQKMLVFRKA
jgi:SAM-dependent methyltransferase